MNTHVTSFERLIFITTSSLAFLTLWLYLYTPILDGDLWFHLLYGRSIFDNHTLTPDHTIYSWTTSSNSNIYCSWLGQIIYYLGYSFSGLTGIIVLRYLASTLFFLTIYYLALNRSTLLNPLTWFSAILSILIIGPATLDKPEALSLSLMSLLVLNYFMFKNRPTGSPLLVYLFPVIMLIWANTHGGFVFGCIYLLIVGIGETVSQILSKNSALPMQRYFHLLCALILSAMAIFITPYGYRYIQQLIISMSDNQLANHYNFVIAYMRTFDVQGIKMQLFAYPAIATLLFVFWPTLKKHELDIVPILTNLVFAFLFTKYIRATYFWAPVFTLTIAYYAGNFKIANPVKNRFVMTSIAITSILLSGWILYQEKHYPSKGRWLDFEIGEFMDIDEEIGFIKNNYPTLRLGNMYDHGSYILWTMWPQTKVMIDARYFPYTEWFDDYINFETGQNVEDFIKKYPFDIVEIKHSAIALIKWFFDSKDWKLVFYGKGAAIFVRSTMVVSDSYFRGKNLVTIKEYNTALNVFNTASYIKDWDGAGIILDHMRSSFISEAQAQRIKGLNAFLNSRKAYLEKNYTSSILNIEEAIKHKVVDIDLYSAALVQQAIIDWKAHHYESSIRQFIKSYQLNQSLLNSFNIALAGWTISERPSDYPIDLGSFSEDEKKILSNWRGIFSEIARIDKDFSLDHKDLIRVAKSIIAKPDSVEFDFVEPTYK